MYEMDDGVSKSMFKSKKASKRGDAFRDIMKRHASMKNGQLPKFERPAEEVLNKPKKEPMPESMEE